MIKSSSGAFLPSCSAETNIKPRPPEQKNHVCFFPDCKEAYSKAWRLEAHINGYHTKVRPYKCSYRNCKRSYLSNSHLRRHLKTFHSTHTLPCTYKNCVSTFSTPCALKRHFKTQHQDATDYVCDQCNSVFVTKGLLRRHMCQHSTRNVYVCSVCLKVWSLKSLFKRHMKCHEIKTCNYSDCEATFKSASALRKHVAVAHPAEYVCDHCGRLFLLKSALRDHLQQHLSDSERETFACPFPHCTRSYSYERNLKQHIAKFHNCERFYCDQLNCRSSFVTEEKLTAHKKRNHKIAPARKNSLISKLTALAQAGNNADNAADCDYNAETDGKTDVFFVIRQAGLSASTSKLK